MSDETSKQAKSRTGTDEGNQFGMQSARIRPGAVRVWRSKLAVAGLLCSTLVLGMTSQATGLTVSPAEGKHRGDGPVIEPLTPTPLKAVQPRKIGKIGVPEPPTPAADWPTPGRSSVDLAGAAPGQLRRAEGLPVWIGRSDTGPRAAGRVSVEVLDRGASEQVGVSGPVMHVRGAAGGPVRLRLDVSRFADAMGGAWASRLQLMAYPGCVLQRPADPECNQPTPLETTRGGNGSMLVADVNLPAADAPSDTATEDQLESPDETAPSPEGESSPSPESTPSTEAAPDSESSPAPLEDTTVEPSRARASTDSSVSAVTYRGNSAVATRAGVRPGTSGSARMAVPTTSDSTVVAASSTASGPKGDWAATSLKSAASWSAGGSTGGFSWSYGLRLPEVASGLGPSLGLGYDSGSVDGQTSAENNQPSWVGVGWSLGPGFIERGYTSCGMDADKAGANNSGRKTGDLCWDDEPLSMSFGEHAGEMIATEDPADGSAPSVFRLRNDDETLIERIGTRGGAGEHFKVTTPDGTQYFFGREQATTGAAATDAAWEVPVFGNHAGEPGYTSGDFAASSKDVRWRWNLSYVVSPAGDTVTYYWTKETNKYGRNRDTAVSTYDRGGWLSSIEYGTRAGEEDTATAPAKVVFSVTERCLPTSTFDCAPGDLTEQTAERWPDVPFDQICTSATSCGIERSAPTFFTRKRLVAIKTQVATGTDAWRTADRWELTHGFPDPGDGDKVLWLKTMTQDGMDASTTFGGAALDNRVDGVDNATALMRFRVNSIVDEFGQQLGVHYTSPDVTSGDHYAQHCRPGDIPTDPATNGRLCFPAEYVPPGSYEPDADPHWFHKHLVDSVTQIDTTDAASSALVTDYDYKGAPAWAKNDNPQVPAKKRTWDQWRGYGRVEILQGDPAVTRSVTRYYRGMHGDPDGKGGTRSVTVTDSTGSQATDHRWLAGRVRESETFNGPGGERLASTITDYAHELTTAKTGARAPRRVLTVGSQQRKPAANGTTDRIDVVSTYDGHGRPASVDNRAYRIASDGTQTQTDRTCTTTAYATNTAKWMLAYPRRTKTVSVGCGVTSPGAAKTITASRFAYDSQDVGVAPTKGRITRTEVLDHQDSTGAEIHIPVKRTSYDTWGRATKVLDAKGRATTSSYAQTVPGAAANKVTTTSADPDGAGDLTAHVTTAHVDDRWGTPTKVVDPAGGITQATYDSLGRLNKVWRPGRATTDVPDTAYSYHVAGSSADTVNGVTTNSLIGNNDTVTSIELFDGLLRPRQTQSETWDSGSDVRRPGRTIVDTGYDTAGRQKSIESRIYDPNPPAPSLVTPLAPSGDTPDDDRVAYEKTDFTYDGASRVLVESVTWPADNASATTTISYDGNITHVTPPDGGIVTSKVADSRGRLDELWQHPDGTADTTGHQITRYDYTPAGQLSKITDHAGNIWSYDYDLRGRQVSSTDPDAGTANKTYDEVGQLISTTDATQSTLTYTYDQLGRKTAVHEGSVGGTPRAEWVYDTLAQGKPTSSTRYHGDAAAYTEAVTGYDAAGRPTGTEATLHPVPGLISPELARTYTTEHSWNADGTPATTDHHDTGALAAERLEHTYDEIGRPTRLTGSLGAYVVDSLWSGHDQLNQLVLGNTYGHLSWHSFKYDLGSGRLRESKIDRQVRSYHDERTSYAYDPAGNITSIGIKAWDEASEADKLVETQCFDYDGLQQLTQAWTPGNGDCSTARSVEGLAGPAPYWATYAYDNATANRASITWRTPAAGTEPEATTTANYTYSATQPHTVTDIAVTVPTGTADAQLQSSAGTYAYDGAGRTTSRPGPGGTTQNLAWDAEGKLAEVTTVGTTTQTALYEPEGDRVIRRAGGVTTAYLPGGLEIEHHSSADTGTGVQPGELKARRYYTHAGNTIAVRTGDNPSQVTTLFADHHGTHHYSVNNGDSSILTTRRERPFGGLRGTVPEWPGERGFVGGTQDDAAGMINIGARPYDAAIGRFITVDPIMHPDDPQQMNGYFYANNNPMTFSDPTGLEIWAHTNDDGSTMIAGQTGTYDVEYAQQFSDAYNKNAAMSARSPAERLEAGQDWRELIPQTNSFEEFLALHRRAGELWQENPRYTPEGLPMGLPMGMSPHCNYHNYHSCTDTWAMDAMLVMPAGSALRTTAAGLGKLLERVSIKHSAANGAARLQVQIGTKIEKQMGKRGWTRDSVEDLINNPARTVRTRDTRHLPGGGRNDAPATAYINRGGGYVVRNDETGDIVQVSNLNDPNWKSPW